jgi:hypothetical protein
MKDSARRLDILRAVLALTSAAVGVTGCGRTNKTADVAQDSILVKDADLSAHRSDTAATTTTLVRDRGSMADLPTLTTGAPVKRSSVTNAGVSETGLQPPTRVNPTPVLPARDSTSAEQRTPTPNPPVTTQPTLTPPPVTQPASPKPPVVIQPSPTPITPSTPKKDSARDSLRVR